MIVLFTDFGITGPYVGQMKAVLARRAPGSAIIDLFADAPAFEPMAAAYLLAAYAGEFAAGDVFLCVVDPGVGGPRRPLVVETGGRWFVGPDNGLFEIVMRRADSARCWEVTWRPKRLSPSFHGRDLFAPVAARLANGSEPPGESLPASAVARSDWPDDLPQVIYIDHFGNAITGLRAATVAEGAAITVAGSELTRARTFGDRPASAPFWYENANGLVEIAVNRGRADAALGLAVGAPVRVRVR